MSRSQSGILSLTLLATLAVAHPAWATPDNLKTFKDAYPGKDSKSYSCKICHEHIMGRKGDLNAYGLDLQKHKAPGDAKRLTIEDLRAIEKGDSDKDGVSNIDEINAGTAPGDPTSTPKGVAPKAPAQTSTSGPASTQTLAQETPKANPTAMPGQATGIGGQTAGAESHKEVKP